MPSESLRRWVATETVVPSSRAFSIYKLVGIVDHVRALVVHKDVLVLALAFKKLPIDIR